MKQSKDCNIKSWQMRNPDKFVKWFHIYLHYIKRSLVATWKINYCIVFLNFICLHYNTTVKAGRTDSGAHWEIQLNSALLIHTIYTYIYVGGERVPGVHRVREIQNVHTRSTPSLLIGYPSHTKLYASAGTMTITQPS